MSDCATTSALLDVYLDDEASPETNALVQAHARDCARCEQALHDMRELKMQLRRVFGRERAPESLAACIHLALDEHTPHRFVETLRAWLVPASAAAVVVAGWLLWPAGAPPLVDAAVSEHIACALDRRVAHLDPVAAAERGSTVAMPWIRDAAQDIRVIDAHMCGVEPMFSHVLVSASGSLASVLIASRTGDSPSRLQRGAFDVSIVSAATHTGYLIAPRAPSARPPTWQTVVLDRVARFLQQLEGTL